MFEDFPEIFLLFISKVIPCAERTFCYASSVSVQAEKKKRLKCRESQVRNGAHTHTHPVETISYQFPTAWTRGEEL